MATFAEGGSTIGDFFPIYSSFQLKFYYHRRRCHVHHDFPTYQI